MSFPSGDPYAAACAGERESDGDKKGYTACVTVLELHAGGSYAAVQHCNKPVCRVIIHLCVSWCGSVHVWLCDRR